MDRVPADVFDDNHIMAAALMGKVIILPDGSGKNAGDLLYDPFAFLKTILEVNLEEVAYFQQNQIVLVTVCRPALKQIAGQMTALLHLVQVVPNGQFVEFAIGAGEPLKGVLKLHLHLLLFIGQDSILDMLLYLETQICHGCRRVFRG